MRRVKLSMEIDDFEDAKGERSGFGLFAKNPTKPQTINGENMSKAKLTIATPDGFTVAGKDHAAVIVAASKLAGASIALENTPKASKADIKRHRDNAVTNYIRANPGASVRKIAAAMRTSKTTITDSLKRLQSAGHVRLDGKQWDYLPEPDDEWDPFEDEANEGKLVIPLRDMINRSQDAKGA